MFLGSQRLLLQPAVEPTPETLQSGPSRAEEVRCRGRIVPKRWLALSFGASGQVARVAVQEGAAVRQGDLLAELKGEDYSLQVRAAEQRVLAAQAELAQAQAAPQAEKVRAAQAQVAAARARLDALRASPTAAELQQARLRVEQARDNLWGAQCQRDALGGGRAGAAYDEARAQVAALEAEVGLAEVSYELVVAGPAAEDIAAAEAELAQAQAGLAALQAGATPEQLAVLRASVAEAQVALDGARASQKRAEDAAKLHAPFAGTVTRVAIQEGQQASPSDEAMVVADLSELQVETIDLTELDIAAVRPEQPVEIAISGFGTPIVQGRVSFISAQATVGPSGEALYRVLIALNRQDAALRWGMTANISFGKRLR